MPTDELLAVQGRLSYGGTDLQDWPRIFLRLVEGGPDDTPDVRGEDRTMPYRDGQLYGNRRENVLVIRLKGWVAGEGDDELEQRADTALVRRELRALFAPDAGPATLHVEMEDGIDYEIEAFPDSAGILWQAPDEGVPTFRELSVKLIAIDPPHWTPTGS